MSSLLSGFSGFIGRAVAAVTNSPAQGTVTSFDEMSMPARDGLGIRIAANTMTAAPRMGLAQSSVFLGLVAHVVEDGARFRVVVPAERMGEFRAALAADLVENGKVTRVPDGFPKLRH
ncbi:MAG: hypothetical protein K1X79_12255 [Oligoflexia bacterium]|nr:hypothetical protein [Oligoflexia bacterium]